ALKTVLPQTSNEDIGKYDEQLNKVDNFDPVLIISPNCNWIAQNTYQKLSNEPIGTAWILTKVEVRKSDFGEDNRIIFNESDDLLSQLSKSKVRKIKASKGTS
ncbi:7665_t:CDS:2, partial [Racocetra persica]